MPENSPTETTPPPPANPRMLWGVIIFILALGILFRVFPSGGWVHAGMDEMLYRENVIKLEKVGVWNYPAICQLFLEDQRKPEIMAKLPPTRFLFIYSGYLWKRMAFGDAHPVDPKALSFPYIDPFIISLRHTACLYSCLTLLITAFAAWRMLGLPATPPVVALMSCAPVQIHFANYALIDSVFTMWALLCLWLLWENLRRPNDNRWLAAFGVCLACLVITKENSFFVYLGLAGLVAVNHWARFGKVTLKLLIVSFVGPLLAVGLLVALAGGVGSFVEIYRLLVSKAEVLPYAILTGDGPWYRYLVDIMLVSPIVLVLAIGGVFSQVKKQPVYVYLVAFVGFTYLIMCNVRYGMNLRYASIWEFSLCVMASAQVTAWTSRFGARQTLVSAIAIIGICAYNLRQYYIFFPTGQLYELVTAGLLHAVKILK